MTINENASGYEVLPWALRWRTLDLGALPQTESTFALSNGHLGLRGTLEEGEPRSLPGTYLNGFYEEHALPYAESGYGYPEAGQTVVNVTDGKIIRLLVGDEPLDLRYGSALEHQRTLDFRDGTLRRETVWESPTGRRIRITTERLVSFTQRAVAAIRYEVEPLDGPLQVVLQSDLLANEPIDSDTEDPRVAAALRTPLVSDFGMMEDYRAVLVHHTRRSGLRVAAGMDHELEVSDGLHTETYVEDDLARLTAAVDVPENGKLRLTKYLAYSWSSQRSVPALRAQVDAALAGALQTGWEGLAREQHSYLEDFWETADVSLKGDDELQQAIRFGMFHTLQAGARGETRAIPAKGLTGPGYDGHAFWETEAFVLPVLTYTIPDAARDALRWRHDTIDKARHRADVLGLRGVVYPWRSINGWECSAYWPAGTAAFHLNADIADAVARYYAATKDADFDQNSGAELLIETARLWCSLGHHDPHGGFRIDGVTGPDEYTAVVDNNTYTNLMAQRNLQEAAAAAERQAETAGRLGVTAEEVAAWRQAAQKMVVPYDETVGVHPQSERFTAHATWKFNETPTDHYPLLLNYPYFDLYRKQVIKQADLVLAMHLRGDAFSEEDKARNVEYYEARTVRDSSLSACTQAVMAAETGHLDLAYDYLGETALTDLHDLHHNARNGLHLGALAGSWIAVVAGLGGMRDHHGQLSFAPRLPKEIEELTFHMSFLGSRFAVDIDQRQATYRLLTGEAITVVHHGELITVADDKPVTLPIPPLSPRPAPSQPTGREPLRRRPINR